MRASTAEGWYVFSSIVASFRRSRGKKPAALVAVNARGTTAAAPKSKVRVTPPPAIQKVPTRSIVLLAGAGFASQAMVRVTDSLLPQLAGDFETNVGPA